MKHIRLFEEFVNEFGHKVLKDDEIEKYMQGHPTTKKLWAELQKPGNAKKLEKMKEFLRDNPHYVEDQEILINIHWDDDKQEYVHSDVSKWNPNPLGVE